ncbi:MAG: hypothetical protein QM650_06050 [Microlunatus sp.]
MSAGLGWGVLRGPGVQRVSRGLYVAADAEPTSRTVLAAYLTVLPQGCTAVDGVSALHLWGVEVGTEKPYRFVTTAKHYSVRENVRIRRAVELPPTTNLVVDPIPALVAARRDLGLIGLVVAGDWLVQSGQAELADVRDALAATTGRDSLVARRAAEFVRKGSESPRESRLRLLLVLAGLPEPECNVEIWDELRFLARVDLYLRQWQVAGEYEGDWHRTDPETYAKDLKRHEELAAFGVLSVRVAKEHLKRPREVVQRVYLALLSRGYDGPSPVFTAEWCQAFEPWRVRGD